jgi:hypothetical protein
MGMAYSHAPASSTRVLIPHPHERTLCGRTTVDQAHAIRLFTPANPIHHDRYCIKTALPKEMHARQLCAFNTTRIKPGLF